MTPFLFGSKHNNRLGANQGNRCINTKPNIFGLCLQIAQSIDFRNKI